MVDAGTKSAATDNTEDSSVSELDDEVSNGDHSDAADHSAPMPGGPCVLFKASFFDRLLFICILIQSYRELRRHPRMLKCKLSWPLGFETLVLRTKKSWKSYRKGSAC